MCTLGTHCEFGRFALNYFTTGAEVMEEGKEFDAMRIRRFKWY